MNIVYGRIKNGKIQLQRFSQEEIPKWEGKEIEIKKVESDRTSQQNRYLWGVVYKLIADHTGYTLEEVHQVYKKKYLIYEKKGFIFIQSTTSLKKNEFQDYLKQVINHAEGELGIIIPDADIEYQE